MVYIKSKKIIALIAILGFVFSGNVAFASASVAYVGGEFTTSSSVSYDATGVDLLVLGVSDEVGDCSATYGGVSMNLAGAPSIISTADQHQSFFYLAAPLTGVNDLVVNCSVFDSMYIEGFSGADSVSGYSQTENENSDGLISRSGSVTVDGSMVVSECGTRYGPVPCTVSSGIDTDLSDGGASMSFGYSSNDISTVTHEWVGTSLVSKAMSFMVLDPCDGACGSGGGGGSTTASSSPEVISLNTIAFELLIVLFAIFFAGIALLYEIWFSPRIRP